MRRHTLFSILIFTAVFASITSAQSDAVTLQVAVTDFAEDGLQLAVDAYIAQNPDINIQLVAYDGFGMPVNSNDDAATYHEDLLTYFQLADVLLVNASLTPEATRAGYVLDLTPLTQSDPNYNPSAYSPTTVEAFVWDFGQWALPLSSNFVTITYNPEAFDAIGLGYPTEFWTLDDLIFAARELTQYNADGSVAIPGLIVQGGSSLDTLLMSAYGQLVVDDNAYPSVPAYDDPALANLLEQWYEFESEGLTTLPSGVNNADVPLRVGNPQQGGGGFAGQNQQTTATALLPGGHAGMNVSGYAVISGTAYPMEAYELALFLTQNANAIAVSGGAVPALIDAPEAEQEAGFRFGAGGGQNIAEAFEPLVDLALANGLNQADMRFASGLGDALDLMDSDGLAAADALETIHAEQLTRLTVADELALTTTITVNPPAVAQTLAPGEITIEFAVLGGGRGGNVMDIWETITAEFTQQDPEVGQITIEQAPPLAAAIPETTDCYYSANNLLSDLDLSTVLSLDPLLSSDPDYDPYDYVSGVLEQVQVDGVTYAMPLSIVPLVMRIDPETFALAGVPVPQGSWTVAEFENAMRQLAAVIDTETTPFTATGATPLLMLITAYGGQPFDLSTDPVTLNFTEPATVTAIQEVLDLVEEGLIAFGNAGPGGGQNASPIIEQSLLGGGGFGGGPGSGNNPNVNRVDVSFPIGVQRSAVAFDLGTMYIRSTTETPEACYRFMSYVVDRADLFDTMPTSHSLLNSNLLLNAQGQATVDFYLATADLLDQPETLVLPSNINQLNFGLMQWFNGVLDSYAAGEVIDLETALLDAEQRTTDYLTCSAGIEFDFVGGGGNFQEVQQAIQDCIAAANS